MSDPNQTAKAKSGRDQSKLNTEEKQHGQTVVDCALQEPPHPAPKIDVNPKVVIVKHDYHGKPFPGAKIHRVPVTLSSTLAFDGEGVFTCAPDDITVFETRDSTTAFALPLIVHSKELGGKTVFIQAKHPSGSNLGTTLKFELRKGSVAPKPAVTEKITCVRLTLDIYKSRPEGGGDSVKLDEGHKINPGRPILVQQHHGDRFFAERAKLVMHKAEPPDFTGDLVLSAIKDSVGLFAPGQEIPKSSDKPFPDNKRQIMNAAIDAGQGRVYWVQGQSVSDKISDTGWKLGVAGIDDYEGDRVTMSVLDAELTLYQSRSIPKSDGQPTAFSNADKYDKGRFVHKQHKQFHGRARIVVQKVKPDGFTGTLTLTCWHVTQAKSYSETKPGTPRISVFDEEIAKSGQAAKAFPIEIPYSASYPSAGKEFWVEGNGVSGELRDSEIRLGVKDYDKGSDRVTFTVVNFKNLTADVPSTPANTVRNIRDGGPSNSPVPRHNFVAGGNNPDKHFSDSFADNIPLPLIEGSVPNADQVNLHVEIEPAGLGIPVSWFPVRTFDDADGVKKLAGNSEDPGLHANAADALRATLEANAVGRFRIRAYIDCNGSKKFDERTDKGVRIDREPFIIMNLVLLRVQGISNLSTGNSNSVVAGADANGITRNGAGVPNRFDTGDFAGTGNDASNMKALIRVVGGGAAGKDGLEFLFAGWCNTITDFANSPTPNHWGLDITHHHQAPIPPPPAPPPALLGLRSFFALDGVIIPGPILDAGVRYGAAGGTGGDSCTGTMGGAEPPVNKVDDPSGVGQRWRINNFDSPGFPIITPHPAGATAVVVHFFFNVDFRCDLVFWTNVTKVAGPSPDPSCRLYASVQTNTWTVRMESTFAGAAFAETRVTPRTVQFNKDPNPTRRATPVVGSHLETRGPEDMPQLRAARPFDPAHPENP